MDPFASKSSDEDTAVAAPVARGARGRGRGAGGGGKARDTGRLVESTQAEDRRMIALVAARPLLFARSTLPVASYYSQVKQLWQEVANIMGWTVAEVRRKWSHIRNSYSRHLRNEIHGMRTGRGRMVSKWYLADELEFLRQHMATDTRPSPSHYSMISFPPSPLDADADADYGASVKLEPRGAPAAPAWYAAPSPPAPAPDDSGGEHDAGAGGDEGAAYFQFFRAIYKDYQELTPRKQRLFRRNCLILLHELVDGAGPHGGAGPLGGAGAGALGDAEAGDAAMNLSYSGYNSDEDKEQKFFVQELKIVNCIGDEGGGSGGGGGGVPEADAR